MRRHRTLADEVLDHLKQTFPALVPYWRIENTGIETTAGPEELEALSKRHDWEACVARYEPDARLRLCDASGRPFAEWRVEIKELANPRYSNVSAEFREWCIQRTYSNAIYCVIDRRCGDPRFFWHYVPGLPAPTRVLTYPDYAIPQQEIKRRCEDLLRQSDRMKGAATALPDFIPLSKRDGGSGMPHALFPLCGFLPTRQLFEGEFASLAATALQRAEMRIMNTRIDFNSIAIR